MTAAGSDESNQELPLNSYIVLMPCTVSRNLKLVFEVLYRAFERARSVNIFANNDPICRTVFFKKIICHIIIENGKFWSNKKPFRTYVGSTHSNVVHTAL